MKIIKTNLLEDTIKNRKGKWVNKGKEGTHGSFKTKKEADAQRKAMFANGFHESIDDAPKFKIGDCVYNPKEDTYYDILELSWINPNESVAFIPVDHPSKIIIVNVNSPRYKECIYKHHNNSYENKKIYPGNKFNKQLDLDNEARKFGYKNYNEYLKEN